MDVTFVTGASSGLGREIAIRLAARGEYIVAVARPREPLEALVREIETYGGRAHAISCDVTDREQVSRTVAAVESIEGPIQRLVACIGGGQRTTISDFRAARLEQMLSLNVIGTVNCLEAILPRMLERRCGHIVTISSLAAARGLPGAAEHAATRAAMSTLLEAFRIDLKGYGLDVTILSPGFVHSDKSKKRRLLEIPIETAAARMVRAIERRQRSHAFPVRLVLAVIALRCMPSAWADAIARAYI